MGIGQLRAQVERLTLQLLELCSERLELAARIGELKRWGGLELSDPQQEAHLLSLALKKARRLRLRRRFVLRLLALLFEEALQRQGHDAPEPTSAPELDLWPSISVRDARAPLSWGSLERQVAAAMAEQGLEAKPSNLVAAPSVRFALHIAFLSCLGPGDTAHIIRPAIGLYARLATLAGARIVEAPSSLEERWALPLQRIQAQASAATKLIVLSSPQNPTGRVFSARELGELASLASSRRALVLSDESRSGLVRGRFISLAEVGAEGMICASARLGPQGPALPFLAMPPRLAARARALRALLLGRGFFLSSNAGARIDAASALRALDALLGLLRGLPVDFLEPEGGISAFVRVRGLGPKALTRLLPKAVMMVPGTAYGPYGDFVALAPRPARYCRFSGEEADGATP